MTLSSFDEIAKYLEQHENSQRIKKLIFFACKSEWENDQDTLDRFKLQELIQELSSLNPTIENLTSSLSIAVKSLSKPKQYSIIASIIIQEIQKLYPPNQEEQTGLLINPPNQEEQTGLLINPPNQNIPVFYSPEPKLSNPPTKTPSSSKKSQYNQFDLRQNLMRFTNPLRVKIILFSALYRKFTFNEEDWLKLRSEDLDSLLKLLFNSCSTILELESKINNAVISLDNPDKNAPAADAIIRVMRFLYSETPVSVNSYTLTTNNYLSQVTRQPVNTNYQFTENEIDDLYDDDDDGNNTCQITEPPT
ncbi:MAG: hypothetical protein WCO29_16610 [Nostocales cyanobacterium ELA583]|jgi:hypothetical protein